MGKGGYLGGSTIIRTSPKLSGRKAPKKGAIDAWIEDAAASGVKLPEDIQLAPVARFQSPKEKEKQKKFATKKKRRSAKKAAKGKLPAIRQVNEPLPEYAELVYALRAKYSK